LPALGLWSFVIASSVWLAACDAGRSATTAEGELLQPQADCAAEGETGGPFVMRGGHYTLHNPRATSLAFELHTSQPWIQVAAADLATVSQGRVEPGSDLCFEIRIDASSAPTTQGVHVGELRITDSFDEQELGRVAVALTVRDQVAYRAELHPQADCLAQGPPGGPFEFNLNIFCPVSVQLFIECFFGKIQS
jgi:hypothetical protein